VECGRPSFPVRTLKASCARPLSEGADELHSSAQRLVYLPQRKSLCPPYQEQSGITGNTIWKLENLRGKTKSMWLQIALPALIDFSSFTSESCRPIGVRHVDAAASIAAKLAGEAQ